MNDNSIFDRPGPWMISTFDKTGVMARPWAEAGYNCLCIDLQHPKDPTEKNGIVFLNGDMFKWVPPRQIVENVAFFAAFPPCDNLAVSGARWFKGKGLGKLSDAIGLFAQAAFWAEWLGVPYMLENPVSTISTYWRKADYSFHPWHFCGYEENDNYTKNTCLWTGGGFVMPEMYHPENVTPDDRIHKCPPSAERANIRSATPMGFARAVFMANGEVQQEEAAQ
ncbi:hypothetical protein [Kiloniella sp.]|uniref:hypothetical protein n=1 Tax=Kiloniella sp. TaxID=1938587 RepID=UPI003B02D64A